MKCSFCGEDLAKGRGTLFVKKDGTLLYFHTRKCRKNLLELKRRSARYKWAAAKTVNLAKKQSKKAETKTEKKSTKTTPVEKKTEKK